MGISVAPASFCVTYKDTDLVEKQRWFHTGTLVLHTTYGELHSVYFLPTHINSVGDGENAPIDDAYRNARLVQLRSYNRNGGYECFEDAIILPETITKMGNTIAENALSIRLVSQDVEDQKMMIAGKQDHLTTPEQIKTYVPSAMACGVNTVAGQMAFQILGLNEQEKYYILDSVEGLQKGMEYCIQLTRNYDNYGNILRIEGEKVYVDNFAYDKAMDTTTGYLRISEKPQLGTIPVGEGAVAHGYDTVALEMGGHSEGLETKAVGRYAHAEGRGTTACYAGHAEGRNTYAKGRISHVEGDESQALGDLSAAGGYASVASAAGARAFGHQTKASGGYSHAEGQQTEASGAQSHAQGCLTKASGVQAHAGGYAAIASGAMSFAHGNESNATGPSSVALGFKTTANGGNSITGGYSSQKAEEVLGTMNGSSAQRVMGVWEELPTENKYNIAFGNYSTALGRDCAAIGGGSQAFGYESAAGGFASLAAGKYTKTELTAEAAVALGLGARAVAAGQAVVGKYNAPDSSHVFEVGAGTSDTDRKTVFWVKEDGTTSLDDRIREIVRSVFSELQGDE